jgi:hypothetical protein
VGSVGRLGIIEPLRFRRDFPPGIIEGGGYADFMMTPQQLKSKYPQLRKFSDEELVRVEEALQIIAKLALEWWEEKEGRSNK